MVIYYINEIHYINNNLTVLNTFNYLKQNAILHKIPFSKQNRVLYSEYINNY